MRGDATWRRDMEAARSLLRAGSKSFHAASLLLPRSVREPTTALYAFCRISDDAVDETDDPVRGLDSLHDRLDRIYAGRPDDDPVDRLFARVVERFEIPRDLPLALLDGYRWDVEDRRYDDIADVEGYSARVASSVGVMMTLIMGRRDPLVLARAADLGLGMQMTNIARDVGEDARRGRLYLPRTWLEREGVDPDAFLAAPAFSPPLGRVVARLLETADGHYARADRGIPHLPAGSRVAIRAARLVYSAIGERIALRGHDSVGRRAYTTGLHKLWLVARALGARFWRPGPIDQPVPEATRFLVSAVSGPAALLPAPAVNGDAGASSLDPLIA